MLSVTIEQSEDTVVLHCQGQMVRGEEATLLCAALGHSDGNIVVDLDQVDAIDRAGVGAFVALQAAGVYLQLLNPAKCVREVLRLAGIDSIFEILAVPPATRATPGPLATVAA